jgi:ribosomal protein L29
MSLPQYKELELFSTISDIDQEIFVQQKNLFDLKLKNRIQKTKPHLFSHTKRRITQLKFKKSLLLKRNI